MKCGTILRVPIYVLLEGKKSEKGGQGKMLEEMMGANFKIVLKNIKYAGSSVNCT